MHPVAAPSRPAGSAADVLPPVLCADDALLLDFDGTLVASNTNNAGENTQVWFRAGCGNLAGWGPQWSGGNNPGADTSVALNRPFLGSLDEVSVHLSVLSAAQIRTAYIAR